MGLTDPQSAITYGFIAEDCLTKLGPIPRLTAGDNVIDRGEGHLLVIEVSVKHRLHLLYPSLKPTSSHRRRRRFEFLTESHSAGASVRSGDRDSGPSPRRRVFRTSHTQAAAHGVGVEAAAAAAAKEFGGTVDFPRLRSYFGIALFR